MDPTRTWIQIHDSFVCVAHIAAIKAGAHNIIVYLTSGTTINEDCDDPIERRNEIMEKLRAD